MPGPLTLHVDPDSVNVPPDAEVTATASGGVPPYTLSAASVPPGVSVQIQGTGPQWSVIISGNGSGQVSLEAEDANADAAVKDVKVNYAPLLHQ